MRSRELTGVIYYIAPLDIEQNEEIYWKHQKFLDHLRQLPKLNVVLCTLRKIKNFDSSINYVVKGADVHLANDLVSGAFQNEYDTAVLVSGD